MCVSDHICSCIQRKSPEKVVKYHSGRIVGLGCSPIGHQAASIAEDGETGCCCCCCGDNLVDNLVVVVEITWWIILLLLLFVVEITWWIILLLLLLWR